MSAEHRYSEQEIAAIFKQAAEAQEAAQQQKSPGEGLTLAELQQIGQETGITPEFIARAAAAVDRTGPSLPPTTYFGIPISVARTVDLPGPLSDDGWDQLVVDLRESVPGGIFGPETTIATAKISRARGDIKCKS